MIRLLTGCALLGAGLLGACGGGSNPFDNPPDVANPTQVGGQKLSFAYFQKCIDPILLAKLTITHDGTTSTNTCAGRLTPSPRVVTPGRAISVRAAASSASSSAG